MNRRDFIGAAIGALVAALLLPFEDFAAWCRRWLGEPTRLSGLRVDQAWLNAFRDVDRDPFQTWEDFVVARAALRLRGGTVSA